jgi:autotransporter-associated beta strand protein
MGARHPLRPSRGLLGVFVLTLSLLMLASPSIAATRIWIGGGGNTSWSTPGNWIGGLVPADGDLVVISGSATTGIGSNDIFGLSLAGLLVDHAYTLTGLAIALGAGGLNVSSLNVTITTPFGLTASQTWVTTVEVANVNSAVLLNGHTLKFDVNGNNELRLGGVISGAGALVKDGGGMVRLFGNNTYTGKTRIDKGYVIVGHANGLGVGDGTEANGTSMVGDLEAGTLQLDNVAIGNEAITASGPGYSGNGALQAKGNSSFAGRVAAVTDIAINVIAPARLTFAGPVSGPGRLVLANDGGFVFANPNNTYSGGLGIGEGGTHESKVTISANEGIPHAPLQAVPELTSLTILGVKQTVAGVTGQGLLRVADAQSELVVNGAGTTSFTGTLSGEGIVRHVGVGSQHFSGDGASMSGQVIVDQGKVTIGTSMPADMTVNAGGTLALGSAFVGVGDILVHDGRLHLAASNGLAGGGTTTHLALTPGGMMSIDGGPGNQIGQLNIWGEVSLNGTLSIAPMASLNAPVNTKYVVIDNDGTDPIVGTFANLPPGAILTTPIARFRIAYNGGDGNDVTLTLVGYGREYLLSEGAIGGFFTTEIAIGNPNDSPAPIRVSFLKPGGGVVEFDDEVAPMSRKTIVANDVLALDVAEFSTVVQSPKGWPLVVERTMTWDRQVGYGAHTERAVDAPSTTWYFAEGSQGFFSTFLLLANPNDVATVATVQYLIEDGPPVTRTYDVAALSRRTIDAGADSALVNRSFGMVVTFALPGLAERAMYFGSDPLWRGGHASAGVKAPSASAFVAEGATGPFFETYVLIANPNSTAVDVTLTFGRQGDTPIQMTRTVAAASRLTLNLETLDPGLANVPVSTRVEASQPVIVERAQYWPDPAPQWYEAHSSAALQTIGTKWGLAEGRVGGAPNYQTYILLANANTSADAHVSITFLRESGAAFTKTFTVPATQRLNVRTGPGTEVPELVNERFGALITSDQPIAVERAMYADAGGQIWAAGTSANATPVP